MAKTATGQTTPHVNIGSLGHADHGKTTLAAALIKVLHDEFPDLNPDGSYDHLAKGTGRQDGAPIPAGYQSKARRYTHLDPTHGEGVKNMLTSGTPLAGAVLVVDASIGAMPDTKEHVRLARQAGVRDIVVALTKADAVEDDETLKLIELEIRELLNEYEYPGEDAPMVPVSADKALQGDKEWGRKLLQLVAVIDEHIPQPDDPDAPFLMPIEEVSDVGNGTVVTGLIERGVLKVKESVDIVGMKPHRISATVTGITIAGKPVDEGQAGDRVDLLLHGADAGDVERGQVAAGPCSLASHTDFEATVYLLSTEEGGRNTPLPNRHRPQFRFHATDTTGEIAILAARTNAIKPGDHAELVVRLVQPVPMHVGSRFTIRDGAQIVGAGQVIKIHG